MTCSQSTAANQPQALFACIEKLPTYEASRYALSDHGALLFPRRCKSQIDSGKNKRHSSEATLVAADAYQCGGDS